MNIKHNKRSVLLCDAGFSALPLLQALKAEGLFVAVCGSRSEDPCHAIADASFHFDYSEVNKLVEVTRQNKFDYLVPGCTDISYASCARVARELNLPGYDDDGAVRIFSLKDEYRNFGQEKCYPIPAYETQIENFNKLSFPALLKPTSSFSGRGITRFENYSDLKIFIDKGNFTELSGQFLLEEFTNGGLYSHSAFLNDGKIAVDFFVNEYCTVYPFQVNSSHLSTKLNKNIKQTMRDWLEKFAVDLSLVNGLLHTQFISNGKSVYLLESCRRCPGDLYSQLILKSTGIDYASLYIRPFIGLSYESSYPSHNIKSYSRHTLSSNKEIIFMSAKIEISATKISYIPLKKVGEVLGEAPTDRAGIYFIEHPDGCEMEATAKDLYKLAIIEGLSL